MKPEEQRMAIAEWCGWRWDLNDSKEVYWIHKEKPFLSFKSPPDYLNDLNAMWEAEEKLTDHTGYWQQLEWIIGVPLKFSLCHATAAQRAEALLKTVGKWTDSTLHTKG